MINHRLSKPNWYISQPPCSLVTSISLSGRSLIAKPTGLYHRFTPSLQKVSVRAVLQRASVKRPRVFSHFHWFSFLWVYFSPLYFYCSLFKVLTISLVIFFGPLKMALFSRFVISLGSPHSMSYFNYSLTFARCVFVVLRLYYRSVFLLLSPNSCYFRFFRFSSLAEFPCCFSSFLFFSPPEFRHSLTLMIPPAGKRCAIFRPFFLTPSRFPHYIFFFISLRLQQCRTISSFFLIFEYYFIFLSFPL